MTSPNRITQDQESGKWTANLSPDVSIKQTTINQLQ